MKVIARARIVEGGAVRLPGDEFEVEDERFKSLGDVVDEAPETVETETPETDPENEDSPDPRKLSSLDRVKNMLGFSGGKVDIDISNLSEISREDIEFLTMDEINDIFANLEGLELNPKTQKKGEMIDAVLVYTEHLKEEGGEENKSE